MELVPSDSKDYAWVIVDELVAPSKVGDYILQWRWDNEQTPQIWTTCSDIKVTNEPQLQPQIMPLPIKLDGASMGGAADMMSVRIGVLSLTLATVTATLLLV